MGRGCGARALIFWPAVWRCTRTSCCWMSTSERWISLRGKRTGKMGSGEGMFGSLPRERCGPRGRRRAGKPRARAPLVDLAGHKLLL